MIKKFLTKKLIFILSILFSLSLASSYLSSIQPRFFQIIVDDGLLAGNIHIVMKILALIIMLSLINSAIKIFDNMAINKMGLYISKQLKSSVVKKVFSSPLNFFDQVSNGELVQRIKEADGISSMFNPHLLGMIVSVLTCLISLIHVIKIDYKFAFVYIVAFPVIALISMKFSQTYKRLTYEIVSLNTKYSQIIHESVAGISEVKSNNLGGHREGSLNHINEKIYKKTKTQNTIFAISSEAVVTINLLAACLITIMFALFFDEGKASVGQYIEITQYSALILAPAQMLSSCILIFQPIRILVQRLKFFEGVVLQESTDGKNVKKIDKIECKNLSFSYGKENILNHLSFCANKNEKILIRGKNGSGKTTIIKLLLRLYDDFSGEILFNKEEIRTLSLTDIRSRIGVAFQESFFFDGNLYENIVCDNTNIEVADIVNALEISGFLNNLKIEKDNAAEIFSLPIVEGGKNLSGGQKRMIAIARALLKNPDVLILDEPTTFLDEDSKKGVIDFIDSTKNLILIVISHDTDLMEHFDDVLCLEK